MGQSTVARRPQCSDNASVNRTDRLYAIVEQLRASSPRPRSVRWLAEHFEVSARTIERDLQALLEAGVPLYAEQGRTGGYVLDSRASLPPVNFTPAEAAAVAVALQGEAATPLPGAARSALTKLMAAMSPTDAEAARALGRRVVRVSSMRPAAAAPRVVEQAIVERRVLRLRYADRHGIESQRDVEPIAVVGVPPNWYLSAWCRLRDDVRAFRFDRITGATLTRETAPERVLPPLDLPEGEPRAAFE